MNNDISPCPNCGTENAEDLLQSVPNISGQPFTPQKIPSQPSPTGENHNHFCNHQISKDPNRTQQNQKFKNPASFWQ